MFLFFCGIKKLGIPNKNKERHDCDFIFVFVIVFLYKSNDTKKKQECDNTCELFFKLILKS